jgi:hypothetical protein
MCRSIGRATISLTFPLGCIISYRKRSGCISNVVGTSPAGGGARGRVPSHFHEDLRDRFSSS